MCCNSYELGKRPPLTHAFLAKEFIILIACLVCPALPVCARVSVLLYGPISTRYVVKE